MKPTKTGGDLKEIDALTRQVKKLAEGQPAQPFKKARASKKKNHFTRSPRCGKKFRTPWPGISKDGLNSASSATA